MYLVSVHAQLEFSFIKGAAQLLMDIEADPNAILFCEKHGCPCTSIEGCKVLPGDAQE